MTVPSSLGLGSQPSPSPIEQDFTTVPFSYRAVLEFAERVPTVRAEPSRDSADPLGRHIQNHRMHVAGRVHPRPYEIRVATDLAYDKLRLFTDHGWVVVSVVVSAYDEKDA